MAVVRYHTELFDTRDNNPFFFSVILGKNLQANTILGLSDIAMYKINLIMSRGYASSGPLNTDFLIECREPK